MPGLIWATLVSGGSRMRITRFIIMGLAAAFSLVAQGRGHGQPPSGTTPGSTRSNAPAGTPAASADRDKGTERAEDVGKGKKKGLNKTKHTRKQVSR
jgi:hypothetical protein